MRKFLLTLAFLSATSVAHAGILSTVADQLGETNFVAAVTHEGSNFSAKPPVSLLFLATRDVKELFEGLYVTVGVDVRSEYDFASQFSNLGIGGGFRYEAYGPVSLHVGYARTLLGNSDGDSPNRLFAGIGFKFKK